MYEVYPYGLTFAVEDTERAAYSWAGGGDGGGGGGEGGEGGEGGAGGNGGGAQASGVVT